MRPENLGFEDCDLNTIIQSKNKNTQTFKTNSKKSSKSSVKSGESSERSGKSSDKSDKTSDKSDKSSENSGKPSIKSGKLPLPRDLESRSGTVKVYSYCKVVADTNDSRERIVRVTESCEEFKLPKPGSPDSKRYKRSKSSSKGSGVWDLDSNECAKRASKCFEKDSHKESSKHHKNKEHYKDNSNDKYLKKKCAKYLDRKLSNTGDKKLNSQSKHEHESDKHLEKKCEKYLERRCSRKHGDRSSSHSSLSAGPRKKSSHKDISKKKSDKHLKKECEKYLEKKCSKRHGERSRSYSHDYSKEKHHNKESCKGSCKEKYLKRECENYLRRKCSKKHSGDRQPNSDSSLGSSYPRERSSHKDLKKKRSSCKGICKEKYLKKECEKYLRRKCSKKHSGDKQPDSHSSLESNIKECGKYIQRKHSDKHLRDRDPGSHSSSESSFKERKGSHKDIYKKKSDHKWTKKSSCTDICSKESDRHKHHSKKHSGNRSSSYSSICPHHKSSHKDLCKKKSHNKCHKNSCKDVCRKESDKHLRKGEKYHERKYSKKHSEDRSRHPSGEYPKKGSDKDKEFKKECEQFLKRTSRHTGDKESGCHSSHFTNPNKFSRPPEDFHKEQSSHKYTDFCKAGKTCHPKKSSHKDICKGKSSENLKEECKDDLCRQWRKYLELKKKEANKDLCKKWSKYKDKSSHRSQQEEINSVPVVTTTPKSPTKGSQPDSELSYTGSENKKGPRSKDIKRPSELCCNFCPCTHDRSPGDQPSRIKSRDKLSSDSVKNSSFFSGKDTETSRDPAKPISPILVDKKENTTWNKCLSILLGTKEACKKNVETATPSVVNTGNIMDPATGSKKSFHNPRLINKLIEPEISSTDSDKKPTDSDTSSKSSSDSTKKYSISDTKMSSIDSQQQCRPNTSQNEEDQVDRDHNFRGRPIPKNIAQTEDKYPRKTKSVIDAHCETMATIKCAMKDLVCKVYETTSEAASAVVTLIQTESAKQLDNIRNYKCKEDNKSKQKPKPKDCSEDENDEDTLRKLIQKVTANSDEGTSLPQKIIGRIASKVESVVSIAGGSLSYENLKPHSYNDDSSEYDIPDPNLGNKMPPKQVSNMIHNNMSTSTNTMFMTIKSKIMSMFTDREVEKTSTTASSTSISGMSNEAETDEDLMNKLIE